MIQCVPDTSGRSLGSHAQILYLTCHHGKALSGFPGSRRLNRSVQCQKVRLERDPLYGTRLFLYHFKFLLKVLEHLLDLGGDKTLALGGDLDGCDTLGGGIAGVQDYPTLYAALAARGYDSALLQDLFADNWLRVLPK